ncbi:MAG: right-handed parallel beta-helix repeat-containing protein, partial [Clostridia bacterium]|nr:right-handed parallel beta-helix repeat-containing protein [Clostridia bacterium]
MKKTRVLVLFLAVVMLLSLVACKKNDDKPKYKTVLLEGWDSYSLVYPKNATSDLTDAFIELTVALKDKYGTMLRPTDDFVMPGDEVPSDTLEILVGNTNREESKQIFDTLKANDYFIGMVNNRLLIIGGSDKATAEAIRHYGKYLLGEEGLLYPEKGYTYEYKYVVDKLTIDGVDISEFVIVRGNGMNADDRVMVTYLQKVIADVCGAKMEVVISSTEETAHEILIGNTGREMTSDELKDGTYAINQADGKLAMYGNGDYAPSFVINKLIKDVLLNIPKGKSYDIQMETVSGEPFSPPTLVSTNLPSKLGDLTGLYDYDIKNADAVFDRFLITREELPTEVTVLSKITPDDYPTSKSRIQIYVSDENGDDSNPGTEKAPLKTIQAAVNKASGTAGGIIWVEGGSYSASEPILINASNSGNIISPLFIIGYGDTPVTLSGGKKIDNSAFKPIDPNDEVGARLKDSVKGNVYCANLYELGWTSSELVTVTNRTQGVLTVNGERFTLARFPNEFNEDGSVLDSKDLLYVKHVYDRGSIANVDSNYYHEWVARVNKPGSGLSLSSTLGWEIQIVDERNPQVDRGDNYMRDEIINWVNTGEIYAYGCMYAGWEISGYRIDENCVHDGNKLGTLKSDGYYSLKSVQPCELGACVSTNSAAGRNTYYLYNAIEALDAPGEWFLDKKTGNLYVYPKSGDILSDELTYMVKSSGDALIKLDKAKYVVIDNITINGANAKGISASDSKNIVIQDVNVTNTKSNGVEFIRCYDSAVTYSEFSYVGGLPVFVAFYDYPRQLQPMNIFIQNNYFHTPTPSNQYAINIRDGCRAVISHNLFEDTAVIMEGLEHIVEYNEFRGGSRDEIDAGMVY